MPIYEYRCSECEHQFDVLQKMSDEPLKDCPECMQPSLVKLISAPAFRLSGTGWYETDFKTDKDKKKNLTDSSGQQGAKPESKSQGNAAKRKDSSTDNSGKPKTKPTSSAA